MANTAIHLQSDRLTSHTKAPADRQQSRSSHSEYAGCDKHLSMESGLVHSSNMVRIAPRRFDADQPKCMITETSSRSNS